MLVEKERIFSFLKGGKGRALLVCVFLFSIIGVFGITHFVSAGTFDFIADILIWFFNVLIQLVVLLIRLVIDLLIVVLSWQEFITVPIVDIGWRITRDIVNMFFSAIMIVIAIGTILGINRYHYKQNLARLVIMIILVNFSKTICGVIIDFSQIVMLTFASAVIDAGVGNFLQAVGLLDLQSLDKVADANVSRWDVAVGVIMGFIMSLVALVVFIAMTAMLIGRLVTLWILIVLSPLAYLAGVLEKTRGEFHGKWWSQFMGAVIMGPVLAFFLYLAFATVGEMESVIKRAYDPANRDTAAGTGALTVPATFGVFGMGIALLIVGMKVAADAGGQAVGAGALRWGQKAIAQTAAGARRRALRAGVGVARFGVGAAGQSATSFGNAARALFPALGRWQQATGKRWGDYLEKSKQRARTYERFVPGLGYAVGAASRGIERAGGRFSDAQLKKAKDDLKGSGFTDLRRTAMFETGARRKAAMEMLRDKKNLGEMQEFIEKNTFDGKPNKAAQNAMKLVQGMYKEAKDSNDDKATEAFEKNFAYLLDGEAQNKIISSRTKDDWKKASEKEFTKGSAFIDKALENAGTAGALKEGVLQMRNVDDGTGNKVLAVVDASGKVVPGKDGKQPITAAELSSDDKAYSLEALIEKGAKIAGSPAKEAAVREYINSKAGVGTSAEAIEATLKKENGYNEVLNKFSGEQIVGILQNKDKGPQATRKRALMADAVAEQLMKEGSLNRTNLGSAALQSKLAPAMKEVFQQPSKKLEEVKKQLGSRAQNEIEITQASERAASRERAQGIRNFVQGKTKPIMDAKRGDVDQAISDINAELASKYGNEWTLNPKEIDAIKKSGNVVKQMENVQKAVEDRLQGQVVGVGDERRKVGEGKMQDYSALQSALEKVKDSSTRSAGLKELQSTLSADDFSLGRIQISGKALQDEGTQQEILTDLTEARDQKELETKIQDLTKAIEQVKDDPNYADDKAFQKALAERLKVKEAEGNQKSIQDRIKNLEEKGRP